MKNVKLIRLLATAGFAVCLTMGLQNAAQAMEADLSEYSIEQLLEPCVQGDNDSRWGAAAETECEQYIRGFADAYLLHTDNGKRDNVCLPKTGNRDDEIRWAFMKWRTKTGK